MHGNVGNNTHVTTSPPVVNNAPGGIINNGGVITNPTVNNFGPPPPPKPNVQVCISRVPGLEGLPNTMVITLKTDVPITEPYYAFVFDSPVEDGSVELGSGGAYGFVKTRKSGTDAERSFVFKLTSVNFGMGRWVPNREIKATVPSKSPVKIVRIISGSGEDGVDENFSYPCEKF